MDARFELEFECQESWEAMREVAPGERHCARCTETVVDLSRMTKKKALTVLGSPNPPCISYLVRNDEPIFARGVSRSGVLAAAASLLAACGSAEEPSLSSEPLTVMEPMTPMACDAPGPDGRADGSAQVGAPTSPAPAPAPAAAGDLDDADASTPHVAAPPIHRRRGRVRLAPSTGTTPVPVRLGR